MIYQKAITRRTEMLTSKSCSRHSSDFLYRPSSAVQSPCASRIETDSHQSRNL